jgi:mevalonate kinase
MPTGPLNSSTLRQTHRNTYSSFFSRNSLVVSCPACFWITGEYAVLYGAVSAKQSVPLRVYCGLSKQAQSAVQIVERSQVYSVRDGMFSEIVLDPPIRQALAGFVGGVLKEHNFSEGVRVEFLSEVPPRQGLGTSGSASAALACAILLLLRLTTSTAVQSWAESTASSSSCADRSLDAAFRAGWRLEQLLQAASSGGAVYCPLVGSHLPVVYRHHRGAPPGDFDDIRSCAISALRLEDIVRTHDPIPTWPLSYGLICTGPRPRSGHLIRSTKWLRQNANSLAQEFAGNAALAHLVMGSAVYSSGDSMWRNYMDSLSILSLDTVKLLIDIFERGTGIERLGDNVNFYHNVLSYMGVSTPPLDRLASWLNDELGLVVTGAKITGAGGGGAVVFFARQNSEGPLQQGIQDFNDRYRTTLSLDYYSERDGYDMKGAVVEQNLEEGMCSEVLPPTAVLATKWRAHSRIPTPEVGPDLQTVCSSTALVVDESNAEIYVFGRTVSSQEIPSKPFAAAALALMLRRYGQPVSAAELASTVDRHGIVAQDKSQFASKVLAPIKRLVTDRLGGTIEANLRGQRVGFSFQLEDLGIDVAVVRPLHRLAAPDR